MNQVTQMQKIPLISVDNFSSPSPEPRHTLLGTEYGSKGIKAYAKATEWPCINTFLLPSILPNLKNINGLIVLDAGCGAGWWVVQTAQRGATVYGVDIQGAMIERAKKTVLDTDITDHVFLKEGSVTRLPFPSHFFDIALSINVACNLSSEAVKEHFIELARSLKKGGIIHFAVPFSLSVVFTNGVQERQNILKRIEKMLDDLPAYPDNNIIVAELTQLGDIHSATFAQGSDGKIFLVTQESQLVNGQEIWRKLPGLVVPNRYHSEEEYFRAFETAGFLIEKIAKPHFNSEKERQIYNNQCLTPSLRLCASYTEHPPYAIYCLRNGQLQSCL